jgi:ABC-type branched-subunit amino acid transport system ATPase component
MTSHKVIEIDHLSYDYPDGTPALRDIHLEVYQHESIAILGPNGAGKSTTLMAISGVLKPKRGEIQFNQDRIHHYSSSRIVSLGIVQIQNS